MRFSDDIFQQLGIALRRIEQQTDLIEALEEPIGGNGNIPVWLRKVAGRLRKMSGARNAGVYIRVSDKFERIITVGTSNSEFIPISDLLALEKLVVYKHDLRQRLCYVVMNVSAVSTPQTVITLADDYYGRDFSILANSEFGRYLELISAKISEALVNTIDANKKQTQKILMTNFLLSAERKASDRSRERSSETIEQGAWREVLAAVVNYLPTWGPFNFEGGRPKAQLLTVLRSGMYLRVRAEATAILNKEEWVTAASTRNIKRRRTVCGFALDEHDSDRTLKFWLVNPARDHADRYASMLYTTIPSSELIIPVVRQRMGAGDEVIALYNFEHPVQGVFKSYHIESLLQIVNELTDFVYYLIDSEMTKLSRDKEMAYVVMRVATRLSATQLHKTKNEFAKLSSQHEGMRRDLARQRYDRLPKRLDEVSNISEELAKVTRDYVRNIAFFLRFDSFELYELLRDVIYNAQNSCNGSGDVVVSDGFDGTIGTKIFCSGIIREHIQSIVMNAVEKFHERRLLEHEFQGSIQISVRRKEDSRQDNLGKDISVAMYELEIRDDGGGMPPEVFERALEPGFTTKGSNGGTGFGLSTALSYMRSVGGDLTLIPREQPDGLIVRLSFPEYDPALHVDMANQLNVEGKE